MKPILKTSQIAGLMAMASCIMTCTLGGGSSSSVERAGGVILNFAGSPAQNVPVTMRPREYLAVQQLGRRIVENGYPVYATSTDSKGRYSFTADDSIREGVYCIEARDERNKSCLFIDSIVIDSQILNRDAPLDIKSPYVNTDNILKPPSGITGTIQLPDSSSGGMVFVYGLNTSAMIQPDGSFKIENLPAGNLRLQVVVSQSGNEQRCTLAVNTVSGTPTTLDTMYGVFYNGNGNTGGAIPSIQKLFAVGDTVLISGNSGNLERSGFAFAGWNTSANGNGIAFNQGDALIIDTAAKVLYAQWSVTDIDGNVYKTVTIGNQVWLAENLRTTKYNDGSAIPLVTDSVKWGNLETPGHCWYNNNESEYKNTYGALYNWHAVNTDILAPKGWHVSTDAEWDILQDYLLTQGFTWDTTGITIIQALAAQSFWTVQQFEGSAGKDLTKNNGSGFSALPGGGRLGYNMAFWGMGSNGSWWTTSELSESDAVIRAMGSDRIIADRFDSDKKYGYSVRCVRDE